MTSRYLWCGVLIVALSVTLSTSAEAQSGGGKIVSNGTIIGVVVAVVAAVTVVAVVVIRKSSPRTITGCVTSGDYGMSVTDEKNKRSYTLSGNTAGIKPGDRMTLQVKKVKQKDSGKTLVWETKKISKDFGVCQSQA